MGNVCNIYDDCFKTRTCACSRKSEKQYAGQIDSVFNNDQEALAFTESNGKYTRIDYDDL
jgi:hypothetical protein